LTTTGEPAVIDALRFDSPAPAHGGRDADIAD